MEEEEEEAPEPLGNNTFEVEPFEEYRARLPAWFNRIPDAAIETWIYRHWTDFQDWLVLKPLEWNYCLREFSSDEVMMIDHVEDWPTTFKYWGADLFDGHFRKDTWLGATMLKCGTTPSPIIVMADGGGWEHPRENGYPMKEPYQLIEGHLRISYLQEMIRRGHPGTALRHQVILTTPKDARCKRR